MRYFYIIFGLILIANSIFALCNINMNTGIIITAALGLPAFLIGVFYDYWIVVTQHGLWKIIRALIRLGYLSVGVVFAAILTFIILSAVKRPSENADAVIVLGAALNGEKPSRILQMRLDKSVEYLNANPRSVVVVSGGKGDDEMRSEASAMAEYLIEQRIAKERILIEDKSVSTEQNFEFSAALLEEKFGTPVQELKIVFVSSWFHINRSNMILNSLGMPAEGLAAETTPFYVPNHLMRETVATLVQILKGISQRGG